MALAVGKERQSLGGERDQYKGFLLTCTALPRDSDIPASHPSAPGAEKRVMLMHIMAVHQKEDSQGKIPNQTQVLPGSGGGGVKAVSLCALEGEGWSGCHSNIA